MQRVIGIDFGTSTTYMNVKRYNGAQPDGDKFSYMPVMFNYGESSGYVASIVRENADGSYDFGEKAAEQLDGATIYTEIKMLLESPDEEQRAMARRIVKEFFKFLYETYTQQATNLGGADDTEETVISYPVKWQAETAEFMLDAARTAGFQNVRGMDEATAAVSTVLCHDTGKGLLYADKPGYLMLIDMGAGTTDLVICKYAARTGGGIDVELVTSWPQSADEPTFGGREIDAALEGYVEDYLTKSLNPALAPMAHNFATIPGQAKKWKELNVSVNLAAGKPVTVCGYISAYGPMLSGSFPAFDRKGFEALIRSGLKDYTRLVNDCLAKTAELDSGFAAAGLDLVILTGGHSAWYFAREIVDGTMEGYLDSEALKAVREDKKRVVSLPNPQTTVSLGLVYSKLPFKLAKKEIIKEYAVSPTVNETESKKMDATKDSATGLPDIHVVILPINDCALEYAQNIQSELELCYGIPAKIDNRNLSLGQRIREAEQAAKGYVLVVREEDEILDVVSVRRFGTDMGSMELQQFEELYRAEMPQQKAAKQTPHEPALPKSQPAQTFQTVENESLDAAMKRFNTQVKDAKRQQKASAKPAQPTQAAIQPGNRNYYKWDDRLLPIVKEFIQKDATLCKINDLYRTDVVAQMRISFGLLAADEIYYALATDGFFTRRSAKGNTGIIIASSGLWEIETRPLLKRNYHITWEMILNGVVDVATKDRMFETINYRNLSYDCPRYAFGETAVMSRLQKLLREKSVELEEGRPI